MEPEIRKGDIALVKEVSEDKLKVGDIIAFRKENIVIVHRIVEINRMENGIEITTKGDANEARDESKVLSQDIEGVFKARIGKLGDVAIFLQTSAGSLFVVVLSIGILLIIAGVRTIKKQKKFEEEQEKLLKEIEELKKEKEHIN